MVFGECTTTTILNICRSQSARTSFPPHEGCAGHETESCLHIENPVGFLAAGVLLFWEPLSDGHPNFVQFLSRSTRFLHGLEGISNHIVDPVHRNSCAGGSSSDKQSIGAILIYWPSRRSLHLDQKQFILRDCALDSLETNPRCRTPILRGVMDKGVEALKVGLRE